MMTNRIMDAAAITLVLLLGTCSLVTSSDVDKQLSNILEGFQNGLSLDRVEHIFKTFEMGKKDLKAFIEDIPIIKKMSNQLSQRNTEYRVLENYILGGKFPDLKEIFEIVSSKRGLIGDVNYIIAHDTDVLTLKHLVKGNVRNRATLAQIFQLYFQTNAKLKQNLSQGDVIAMSNMVYTLRFIFSLRTDHLFEPLYKSSDYGYSLQYLLNADYSPLLKLRPLPVKYSVSGVDQKQTTEQEVSKLIKDVHGKYATLMKGKRTSSQVETAYYDVFNRVLNILVRAADEAKEVMAED